MLKDFNNDNEPQSGILWKVICYDPWGKWEDSSPIGPFRSKEVAEEEARKWYENPTFDRVFNMCIQGPDGERYIYLPDLDIFF